MATQFWVTSMSDVARARGPAVRRRERFLRAFWRHEQFSAKMATVTMSHHSSQRTAGPCVDVATQTLVENFCSAATYAATATPTSVIFDESAPVIEYVTPAPTDVYAALIIVIEYAVPAPVVKHQLL